MNICDVMKRDVKFVSPDNSAKEAARIMRDQHVGVLPVLDNGKLVGMITDRDICCRVTATGRDAVITKVGEVMVGDVATCLEGQDINDVARLMVDHHIRRIAVINTSDELTGIVSIDDLAHQSHDLASTVLEASAPAH